MSKDKLTASEEVDKLMGMSMGDLIKEKLNQSYDMGIDHSAAIVNECFDDLEIKDEFLRHEIIRKLNDMKSK